MPRGPSPLSASLAVLSLLVAHISPATAITFDCTHVRKDKVSWNLSKLGGPRTISHSVAGGISTTNTTFTIDICAPLKPLPDLGDKEQCPQGTRICAVERTKNTVEDTPWQVHNVIGIAGDYGGTSGRTSEPKIVRLKGSSGHSDNEREGLRVTLGGGKNPNKSSGRDQKAIIEFECDDTRTGLEDWEGKEAKRRLMRREDDKKKKESDGEKGDGKEGEDGDDDEDEDGDDKDGEEDEGNDRSLQFISYKGEENGSGEYDALRLIWKTKYACENAAEAPDAPQKKGGLGFFGWLFLVLFLAAIGYLIVGAWINYSRYGAQGWDLVPHGDTIRDLPYILKDWAKSVVDTVQGRGYRGGYSAV